MCLTLICINDHLIVRSYFSFFFFNDTATTEIYTLSLHDALPNSPLRAPCWLAEAAGTASCHAVCFAPGCRCGRGGDRDRGRLPDCLVHRLIRTWHGQLRAGRGRCAAVGYARSGSAGRRVHPALRPGWGDAKYPG